MEPVVLPVDVCIVCALPEEVRAFLKVVQPYCEGKIEAQSSSRYLYSYRLATIKNKEGERLRLHISWLARYGPQEMTLHLSHVLEECQPRIAIMTGICAGDATQVQLGDLVVAERTFTYDSGKFTRDKRGRQIHLHDTLTYQLDEAILQFLGLFDAWKSLLAALPRPPAPPDITLEEREVRCYLKAMASGNAVREDNPFEDVQVPVRGTAAIDMEGAAFAQTASRHHHTPWLVVKGVCDYADSHKNDAYHDFAARASALYALSFIQHYVTQDAIQQRNPLVQAESLRSSKLSRRSLLLVGLGVGAVGIGATEASLLIRNLLSNGSHSSLTGGTPTPTTSLWLPQNSGTSQEDLTRITWSGTQFVAVGNNGTILLSPDGRTWTTQHAPFPGPFPPLLTDVTWSGTQFVAVGPSTILTSPDGRIWTIQARYNPLQVGFALAIAGSRTQLVVVGDRGTILTSPDGHTWTLQNSGTSQRLNDIVWSGTQFVAVGDSGTVLSSPDGRSWTRRYSATVSQIWSGVAWSGSRFVAVGINAMLTSPDGISWTSHGPSTLRVSAIFTDIAWAQSQFVAVGYGGFILSSPDGETWTPQASDTEVSLFGIAGSQSRFIAVGQAGTIVASA